MITVVPGFYSWSVYRTNLLWREAAKISATLSYRLTDSAGKAPLVILNAPDNLRSVPVFHNGLAEAISWLRPNDSAKPIQIVAFQDLQSATDEILIMENEVITVRALDPADRFIRITAADSLDVMNAGPESFDLRAKPCASTAEIVFFSGGTIKELNDT